MGIETTHVVQMCPYSFYLHPFWRKIRMAESLTTLKWGVERRLEFIEFRLFWEGGVNRSDIIEMFDVSVPQASKDLTLYQERAPHNALYDKSAKRYVASEHFEPQDRKSTRLNSSHSCASRMTSSA